MIPKQKITFAVTIISFIASAGVIETKPFISLILLAVAGAAVVLGGLDSKKTSIEQIQKDYKL